jgi:carbamoyltransferase
MRKSGPWILGISASPHNGAVCLLNGDEIVAAIQEERLNRRKRAPVFGASPSLALQYCLEHAGICPSDLKLVVCCVTNQARVPQHDLAANPILQTCLHNTPTLYIPHHYGHAFSTFATSGFAESAILVIDGIGSPFEDFTESEKAICHRSVNVWETASLYFASGTTIEPVEKHLIENFEWIKGNGLEGMPSFGSIGGMYSAAAIQIFGDIFEAGKVMGLAPYGRPEICTSEFFELAEGRFVFHDNVPRRFRHTDRWPLRHCEYANLASSTQVALERAVMHLSDRLFDMTHAKNLCYAGGVALNSVANERILRESRFQNIHIIPAAEDSGTAIGAAYYGLWQLTKSNTKKALSRDAVGRVYSEEEIQRAIEDTPSVEVMHCGDSLSRAVELLCEGNILGWFEGRSELGPRALGQRSIFCDPRRPDAKEVLNSRVKHRESFRPFAPLVLRECVGDWFDVDGYSHDSPFMLRVCKFNENKKRLVPGVVHIDDTGRLQTITNEANPRLFDLVTRFHKKTGVPIILNTSFNIAGEPIVETPRDALKTLLSTGIDYCVLDSQIIAKRKAVLFESNEVPWPERLHQQISEALDRAARSKQMKASDAFTSANKERAIDIYVGEFEHHMQEVLSMRLNGHQLKATFASMNAQYVPSVTAVLTRYHEDVFVVPRGPFSGTTVVFIFDQRSILNSIAILTHKTARNARVFFREANHALDSSLYDRLVGEYTTSDGVMVIRLCDEQLTATVRGQKELALVPVKYAQFIVKHIPGYSVEFEADSSGEFATAIVTQPNGILTLQKTPMHKCR